MQVFTKSLSFGREPHPQGKKGKSVLRDIGRCSLLYAPIELFAAPPPLLHMVQVPARGLGRKQRGAVVSGGTPATSQEKGLS